ncbi:MAG: haloacid dehalogenase-like hydrolase [Woeseiaceae bacterium]|nr:haloacid dehalogenase-like hydrolase [Woeseiaceae bacterium]
MTRAVLFDIDGTLLHSAAVDDALYRKAVRQVLGDVRLRPSLHDYEAITDTGILGQILLDNEIAGDPLNEVRSRFVQLLEQHVDAHGPFVEIAGASDFLGRLEASVDHAVAFATGGWRESAMLKLDSAGLSWNGFPLASSNDHHKRTTIMEIALSHLGGTFDSVTYYGDGPWDRDACRKLGWNFVAVGPELKGLESYNDHEVPA